MSKKLKPGFYAGKIGKTIVLIDAWTAERLADAVIYTVNGFYQGKTLNAKIKVKSGPFSFEEVAEMLLKLKRK